MQARTDWRLKVRHVRSALRTLCLILTICLPTAKADVLSDFGAKIFYSINNSFCESTLKNPKANPPWPDLQYLPHVSLPVLQELATMPDFVSSIQVHPFSVVKAYKGIHGGTRLAIRTQVTWGDNRKNFDHTNEDAGDYTADLRLIPYLLGPRAAFYFGYQILDEYTIVVPDAKEVIGAIERINSGISEDDLAFVPMNFIEKSEVLSDDQEFVTEFAVYRKKPLSHTRRSFFHDITNHALEAVLSSMKLYLSMYERSLILNRFVQLHSNDLDQITLKRLYKSTAEPIDSMANASFVFNSPALSNHLASTASEIKRKKYGYFRMSSGGINTGDGFREYSEPILTDVNTFYRKQMPWNRRGLWDRFVEIDRLNHPQAYVNDSQIIVDFYKLQGFIEKKNSLSLTDSMGELARYEFAKNFVARFYRVDKILTSMGF